MVKIKELAQLFKQLTSGFGTISQHCEFCDIAPTDWIKVGATIVFVCETHLGEFLSEVARK